MKDLDITQAMQEKLDRLEIALVDHVKEHKLLERAFESDHIGKCLLDSKGRFLKVNAACCRIWERSRKELLATTFQAITHPDDLTEDLGLIEALKNDSVNHYSMAKRYIMPDGTFKPCWLEVSTILDDEGNFYLFFSKVLSHDSIVEIQKALERFHD